MVINNSITTFISRNRNVALSWRTRELPNKGFPENFEQKPEVLKVEGRRAFFKDGTAGEFDSVIMVRTFKNRKKMLF